MQKKPKNLKTTGSVRIIGGIWRGRKLKVLSMPGLRPTPDRVRETLFNWLAPCISGARCIDLFAGSGALSFEAISRGAAYVEMIDQSKKIVAQLKEELLLLEGFNGTVYEADSPHGLQKPLIPFDIAFLDPPYDASLLIPSCHYLEEHQFLKHEALIYLESNRPIKAEDLPKNWQIIKAKIAGDVAFHLAKRM